MKQNSCYETKQIETQDWTTGPNHPSYEENGTWEDWMSFSGISCNQAFDEGYDSVGDKCKYHHPALIEAFNSGVSQYQEEN